MSNDYYNLTTPFVPHTLVKAADVNTQLSAIESAFDMLPNPSTLTSGAIGYGTLAGGTTAYTVTLTPTPVLSGGDYPTGMFVSFKVNVANTGASTININSLGVRPLKRSNGDALVAGDLVADSIVAFWYDTDDNVFKAGMALGSDIAAMQGYKDDTVAAASDAQGYASSASSSASSASGSASSASGYATAASNSADAAAASYDAFDDRYLGAKSSDPTLDNDGNALATGAMYYNTTSNVMRVYSGSSWGTVASSTITLGTEQATTSGNVFSFSVPATATQIVMTLDRVSLSGTDNLMMWLGPSTGELSGYYGSVSTAGGSQVAENNGGNGARLTYSSAATAKWSGMVRIVKVSSSPEVWSIVSQLGESAAGGGIQLAAYTKVMTDPCAKVGLTRTGANTFDNGTVNIWYE